MTPHRRALLTGLMATGVAPAARAAESSADRQGLYLPNLSRLRAHDPKALGDLQQEAAMVGDEATALKADPDDKPSPPLDLRDARAVAALDLIADKARGRRLVILNEAHNVSRCRAFGEAVALRLRAQGFSILAAETFLSGPGPNPFTAFQAGGPIRKGIGYYTGDPAFAEMLRGARFSGYRFAAYEQTQRQQEPKGVTALGAIRYREHAEAVNLAALLRREPNARVLVYCGYSHAAKRALKHERWMAARLMDMTGVDPLTIDQAFGWPGLRPDPRSHVDQVLARFSPSVPIALERPSGEALMMFDRLQGAFDIQVVHPRFEAVDGRPGWLARAPSRREAHYTLPADLEPGTLAQAVPAGEALAALDAIPSDQYPVLAGQREAIFFLKPGRYVARIETIAGRRSLGLFTV